MKKPLLLLCIALSSASIFACDSETRIDCTSVCDRYKDCFDDKYDADECADNCVAHADDSDQQKRVDLCDRCIDGESCAGAAFMCADDCVGIVP